MFPSSGWHSLRPANQPHIRSFSGLLKNATSWRRPSTKYQLDAYPSQAIYDVGLAVVFLTELDPEAHRQSIQTIFGWLLKAQKAEGGWGYPGTHISGRSTGDTSMTQYAALACWSCRRTGAAEVPDRVIQDLSKWLVRVQDPSGAWGYQGNDPGVGTYRRLPQDEMRISLCAAALGSLYVCSDLLGINTRGINNDTDLPAGLRRVETAPQQTVGRGDVPTRLVREGLRDGHRYLLDHFVAAPENWEHYYLYALERAMSFAEWTSGTSEPEPNWYNECVEHLDRTQNEDGSWVSEAGEAVDTAFSVLFLLRSTRLSIRKAAAAYDGILRGGRGLPSETQDVRLQQGRLVRSSLRMQADQLLELLEDETVLDASLLAADYEIALSIDPEVRTQQLHDFRQALREASPAKRLAAARVLARERELSTVPDLIHALSDPDVMVLRTARDGLRAISRRPLGIGLPDDPHPSGSGASRSEMEELVRAAPAHGRAAGLSFRRLPSWAPQRVTPRCQRISRELEAAWNPNWKASSWEFRRTSERPA